jgi:succinoglycan biosynthesis protein ExoM
MKHPDISVCVCTFRRPESLKRMLESLFEQCDETPHFEVVLVDNDAAGTAKPVFAWAADRGMDVRYELEPVQNVARARNRGVREVRGEYVAFIDDTGTAGPRWLIELVTAVKRHRADGAFGPVHRRFAAGGRAWIHEGGFFDDRIKPTGTPLAWNEARTGNALIRREALDGWEGPFDEAFGLTGGEDVDLFERMLRRGARLIAVESAPVVSALSAGRATVRWLTRRHFNNGLICTRIQCSRMPCKAKLAYARHEIGRFAKRGLGGTLRLFRSRAEGFGEILEAFESAGKLAGFVGIKLYPYRGRRSK